MSTSMHPGVLDSAEHALPPPRDAHDHGRRSAAAGGSPARRDAVRHRAAIAGAVAFALAAVAILDRAMSLAASDSRSVWLAVAAGLGAAAASLALGRIAHRAGLDAHGGAAHRDDAHRDDAHRDDAHRDDAHRDDAPAMRG